MKDQGPITSKLRDLLFEVQEGREAKFLLCVCDDRGDRRDVRRQLISQLRADEKKVVSISAKKAAGKLLTFLFDLPNRQEIDCINVWGIPGMKASAAEKIFSELNFHRDAITSLGVPVLVWLSTEQVQRLAAVAPDFWSRRTAVYLFNKPSTKDLLAKLFSRGSLGERRRTSDIEGAFEEILKSEKDLASCLRRKEHFSVEVADGYIKSLHSNLAYLAEQCNSKRQLEVALWLWNATQVEGALFRFVRSMPPEDKNVYGDVYTDRSELVLYMAERMPTLLEEYGKLVEEKVRQRKRANLVAFATKIATKEIDRMLNDIEARENRSIHFLSTQWTQDYEEYDEPLEIGGGEEKLVYELEAFLSGYESKRPTFFSESEAKLLKALYSESPDPRQVASRMNMSVSEARKRIAQLEKRVRSYLGAGSDGLSRVVAVDLHVLRTRARTGAPGATYTLIWQETRYAARELTPHKLFASWDDLAHVLRGVFHVSASGLRALREDLVRSRVGSISNVYVSKATLVRAKLMPAIAST